MFVFILPNLSGGQTIVISTYLSVIRLAAVTTAQLLVGDRIRADDVERAGIIDEHRIAYSSRTQVCPRDFVFQLFSFYSLRAKISDTDYLYRRQRLNGTGILPRRLALPH